MSRKKMIIAGAGIAGLSAGCYAQMNGYETKIFEMTGKPGGVCTSWQRKGFTFDYCLHNLAGTGKGSGLRQVWDELGAFASTDIINHEMFVRVEGPRGEKLNLYTNLSHLEKHLKEIAPEDSKAIEEYIQAARSLRRADLFTMNMGGVKRTLGMLPHLPALMKWGKVPMEDYAKRFTNPFLRRAFSHLHYDVTGPEMPVLPHLIFMSGLETGDLGWPRGGSLAFSRRIEKRFIDLGGEVKYDSRVEKVLVEDNRARGVRLADGSEYFANIIVSAADGYSTIYKMLGGQYTNDLINSYYKDYPESQPFGLQVYLGVNRDFSGEPHAITLLLEQSLKLEAEERDSLYLELFKSSTGLTPEGKSVIKVVTVGNYEYWKALRADMAAYREEKNRVCEAVLAVLEKRFPGIKEQVEAVDVTTPVTAERYTSNFHGWQPWGAKTGTFKIMREGLSKSLPGLKNFYMAGQWAGATIGVSSAALMGRNLIKEICKEDWKRFKATTP